MDRVVPDAQAIEVLLCVEMVFRNPASGWNVRLKTWQFQIENPPSRFPQLNPAALPSLSSTTEPKNRFSDPLRKVPLRHVLWPRQ